jgi:energy-coupling factor transporter ATP-binding protein EcfA2
MSSPAGRPVYFLSLSLREIRTFGPDEAVIDLSDGKGHHAQWTIVLGENGVGKTTLLECIRGLSPLPERIPSFDGPSIHAVTWLFTGALNAIARIGAKRPIEISAMVVASDEPEATPQPIGVRFRRENEDGASPWSEVDTTSPLGNASQWLGAPIIMYRAVRDLDLERPDIPDARADDATESRRLSDDSGLVSIDEWLLHLHHLKFMEKKWDQRTEYDDVSELLVGVLPGVRSILVGPSGRSRGSVSVLYETDEGYVRQADLGFGYRSIAAMVGDLAFRLYNAYGDRPDPLSGAAVVLIDELDLHLHPVWQRQVIGLLSERFPNVQFIATAHSPLLVQAAAGQNLVVLRRDPNTRRVRVENDLDAIAQWRLDQIVTSELFGVPTARSPLYDKDVARREEIVARGSIGREERDELRDIESRLGDVPLGETADDRRSADLLRRTLDVLELRKDR